MLTYYTTDMNFMSDILKKRTSSTPTELYTHLSVLKTNKDLTLDTLFKELRNYLLKSQKVSETFLNEYGEQLFYEIAFDIYNTAKSSINLLNDSRSLHSCAIEYVNAIGSSLTSISDSNISKIRKKLLSDNIFSATANMKLLNFHNYIVNPLRNADINSLPPLDPANEIPKKAKDINIPMTDSDFFFYLNSVNSGPYCSKHKEKGINIQTFFKLLDDYLSLHPCKARFDFAEEYSAYLFVKLYYPIQFSNYICGVIDNYSKMTALETPTANTKKTETINLRYIPLYKFTRIFDTQYLSLTDYIYRTYKEPFSQLYNDDNPLDKKCPLYIFHYYSDYILPTIALTLKYLLFENCANKKDADTLKGICTKSEEYLYSKISKNYSYRKQLEDVYNRIKEYKYPDNNSDLLYSPKLNQWEQCFNTTLSKCFFQHEIHPFINICGNEYINCDDNSFQNYMIHQYTPIIDLYEGLFWKNASKRINTPIN